ncbi:hypothetical protein C8J57DRAFT_1533619 [Mycena rebaudengoi]|nr:hypothetical protein C8J57DRAFT_1533619 [Mycena rebaudengoi]
MPKTSSTPRSKSKTPYKVTKAKKRGLLAQGGQATLENISALQQTGMKKHGKAKVTTKKYDQAVAAMRKWLKESLDGKQAEKRKRKAKSSQADSDSESDSEDDEESFEDGPPGPDPIAPDVKDSQEALNGDGGDSFKFDAPGYKDVLNDIPNEYSPKVVALFLVYKIFHQGRKIGTADTARAGAKRMWKLVDGDTYRGKWHHNPTTNRWEGNPVDSAEVDDTMEAIKNKLSPLRLGLSWGRLSGKNLSWRIS